MKRIVLALIIIAAVVALSILSIDHWHKYRDLQQHRDAQASALASKEVTAANHAVAAVTAENNTLVAECNKGLAAANAYNALPTTKTKLPVPTCPLAAIQ